MPATNANNPTPSDTDSTRFISPRELALRWCVARSSVARIAKRARLTTYYLGEGRNGSVRFRLDEVERFESTVAAPQQERA